MTSRLLRHPAEGVTSSRQI